MVVSWRRLVVLRTKTLSLMLLIVLVSFTFVQILMCRLLCFVFALAKLMVLPFY